MTIGKTRSLRLQHKYFVHFQRRATCIEPATTSGVRDVYLGHHLSSYRYPDASLLFCYSIFPNMRHVPADPSQTHVSYQRNRKSTANVFLFSVRAFPPGPWIYSFATIFGNANEIFTSVCSVALCCMFYQRLNFGSMSRVEWRPCARYTILYCSTL